MNIYNNDFSGNTLYLLKIRTDVLDSIMFLCPFFINDIEITPNGSIIGIGSISEL